MRIFYNNSKFGSDTILLLISIGILITILGTAFFHLALQAESYNFFDVLQSRYIKRVLVFTLWQAALSTGLSLLFAIPLARFFYYHNFPGKRIILTYFGLCLVMPVIVAILGIIQVHGNSGYIVWMMRSLGIETKGYLYGLFGILLAHVFFNTPLAVRSLLSRLNDIPQEQWRSAIQLNFTPWQRFRLVELPALRSALPGLAALIFMLCFTSFAIILSLGGGPKATTLEVAIYQALHFDFDMARAVTLSGLQLAICAILSFILVRFGKQSETEISYQTGQESILKFLQNKSWMARLFGWVSLALILLLVFPPLFSVIAKALYHFEWNYLSKPALLNAGLISLGISLSAGSLSILLAVSLCLGLRHIQNRSIRSFVETIGALILVFSPFALATGLFIVLSNYASLDQIGPFLVILINALMSLPFALRILIPAFQQRFQETQPLCISMGIQGWTRFRMIDFSLLRKPIGLAMAYATTLSIGDFGIIALFGSQDFSTLPLYIYRAIGSYRLHEASFAALILILTCYLLFIILERLIGGPKGQTQ
ncbi:thiamine/thiamine pyrophosphate ABC transporter permease [Curvivirga aplysinae]|uniref:thiamine/thiamine pyrophosphate ABC transporter permease n=1 Tax=Curvivirga aplysinae TaxID=2529852 RepID=UPI0012BCB9B7|nr:thiamine/thiamine pyrophosphate ABC transporter permease [Curvivirga aplysinae]MTI11283.1 thiamine/thiamine pyrophosphate ABC transporter, permease protein [Curvivirga aplysinae]